jgi:hypothetical protein
MLVFLTSDNIGGKAFELFLPPGTLLPIFFSLYNNHEIDFKE